MSTLQKELQGLETFEETKPRYWFKKLRLKQKTFKAHRTNWKLDGAASDQFKKEVQAYCNYNKFSQYLFWFFNIKNIVWKQQYLQYTKVQEALAFIRKNLDTPITLDNIDYLTKVLLQIEIESLKPDSSQAWLQITYPILKTCHALLLFLVGLKASLLEAVLKPSEDPVYDQPQSLNSLWAGNILKPEQDNEWLSSQVSQFKHYALPGYYGYSFSFLNLDTSKLWTVAAINEIYQDKLSFYINNFMVESDVVKKLSEETHRKLIEIQWQAYLFLEASLQGMEPIMAYVIEQFQRNPNKVIWNPKTNTLTPNKSWRQAKMDQAKLQEYYEQLKTTVAIYA